MQKMVSHVKIAPQTTEIKIDIHLIYTPFGPIIGKKQYSFSSKNGPKGVLLLVKEDYSFSFKNPPEAVFLLLKNDFSCHNITINII